MSFANQSPRGTHSEAQILPSKEPVTLLVHELPSYHRGAFGPARAESVKPAARPRFPFVFFAVVLLIGLAVYGLSQDGVLVQQADLHSEAAIPPAPIVGFSMLVPDAEETQSLVIQHTVRKGETLGTIAGRYGLPLTVADAVQSALLELGKKQQGVPTSIRVDQNLSISLNGDGALSSISSSIDAGRQLSVELAADGGATASIEELPSGIEERIAVGLIDTSFAAAASKAGISYDTVDDLVDLFSNRVSFHRDFRKGDRFSLIFQQKVLSDGTAVAAGPILAAALQVGGENLVAIRFVGSDGKMRYFDEKGELLGNSFLRYPLKFSRISSSFSTSRFHPVLKRRRAHNGVDFAAPTGTPVRSVADGVVTFAGRMGGGGNTIKVRHNDRYSTAYLHLSKIGKGIKKGARVTRGEMIGAVGMTGLATGPHLHFSFYDRGRYVDPLKIKLPTVDDLGKGTRISPLYLRRVLFTLEHYQNISLENFYWG